MRIATFSVVIFTFAAACSSGVTIPSLAGGPGGSDAGGGGGGGGGGDDAGGAPSGGTGNYVGKSENGRATYYDADGSGNCSFDPSPNDLDVAAMDDPEWNNSAVCGECVAITGPNGNVTVRIVDRCPE
ncbi:MAG: expansin EXLX1 family cellulose-binding protein, partial [Polyangiaceae bacterium]